MGKRRKCKGFSSFSKTVTQDILVPCSDRCLALTAEICWEGGPLITDMCSVCLFSTWQRSAVLCFVSRSARGVVDAMSQGGGEAGQGGGRARPVYVAAVLTKEQVSSFEHHFTMHYIQQQGWDFETLEAWIIHYFYYPNWGDPLRFKRLSFFPPT